MTKLRVSLNGSDKTGESLYCSKEVRIDGQVDNAHFTTPITSIDVREVRKTDNIAPAAIGLNEIFRSPPTKYPKNRLRPRLASELTPFHELVYNTTKQHEFNLDLENQIAKLQGMSIFFFEYKGETYPSKTETEFILDTEYSYSHVPCLPITPTITKNIRDPIAFQAYFDFIKSCVEYLKSFNEKPIMGIIPNIAYGYLSELIELYINKDINAFCIDFDCHTAMSHKPALTKCFRVLQDYEQLDSSLIYALNVNSGRFIKNRMVVNAKDILSFGFGLDAIGKRHRNKIDFRKIKEKLGSKWQDLDRTENKARLFMKMDYGYYKAQNASAIPNYPSDTSIPQSVFTDNFSVANLNTRHFEKIFNMEQLGLESSILRSIIKNDKPIKHLERKAYVDPKDIKQIRIFKENIANPPTTQVTLDESNEML